MKQENNKTKKQKNKKTKKHFFRVFVFLCFCVFVFSCFFTLTSSAATSDTNSDIVGIGDGSAAANIGLTAVDPRIVISRVINVILGFLGIIALSLILYAGWLIMNAKGDSKQVEEAQKLLKNAVIGLIIILSSYAIATFLINLILGILNGTPSDPNGPGGKQSLISGLSALGNGPIEYHYPTRNQKEVPRNTMIMVTFREPMQLDTICSKTETEKINSVDYAVCNGNLKSANIRIYTNEAGDKCTNAETPDCTSNVTNVTVTSDITGKIFVFDPADYLGSPTTNMDYTVQLTNNLKKANGEKAFTFGRDYLWTFQVSTKVDLDPPQVKSIDKNGIFPLHDDFEDNSTSTEATAATGLIEVSKQPKTYIAPTKGILGDSNNPPLQLKKSSNDSVDDSVDITGTYQNCKNNGFVYLSVANGSGVNNDKKVLKVALYDKSPNTDSLTSSLTEGEILTSYDSETKKYFAYLGCGLTVNFDTKPDTSGNAWYTADEVKMERLADTLTIDNKTYTFVENSTADKDLKADDIKIGIATAAGVTPEKTALENTVINIATKITNDANSLVNAVASTNKITLTAKTLGLIGNDIGVTTSATPDILKITSDGTTKTNKLSGGTALESKITPVGKTDQPRNAIITVNFTEAMNPITLSGPADGVKDSIRVVNNDSENNDGTNCSYNSDCKSYKCEDQSNDDTDNKTCINNYLDGTFVVSNMYQTVEFIPKNPCGVNACGEQIYCLPENSNLKVELVAASLQDCTALTTTNNCDKADDYKSCSTNNFCQKTTGTGTDLITKNYPVVALSTITGLMDACFNSFDGNRNDNSEGPASYFDQNSNSDSATTGDNYQWSFFINNKIETDPPTIENDTSPISRASAISTTSPVIATTSELMQSSTLSTGSIQITRQGENEPIVHKRINLYSYDNAPLGYWVTNESIDTDNPKNDEADKTKIYINHSDFSTPAKYKAEIGSGIKDIYQNCFKPCTGPACGTNTTDTTPSCCIQPGADNQCKTSCEN